MEPLLFQSERSKSVRDARACIDNLRRVMLDPFPDVDRVSVVWADSADSARSRLCLPIGRVCTDRGDLVRGH